MDEKHFQQFETGVVRTGTGCAKWDGRAEEFGRADVIPLWVADMDFAAPESVVEALTERARHGVYGYMAHDDAQLEAVKNWMLKRHGLSVRSEWILSSPGVVDSLLVCLRALIDRGDLVAVQPPVYGPFYSMVERAGAKVYRNPLIQTPDGWKMDLNQLEEGLKLGVKAVLLCSPHNPVGRVWTRDELDALAKLCARYGAYIISDEIHSDIIMPGYRHTPVLSADENAVLLISSTKTFGLAALRQSSLIVQNGEMRARIQKTMEDMGVSGPNLFGMLGQTAAYQTGEEWLENLLEYLDGTRACVEAFFAERLPELGLSRLEGTYLMWMDARALGMPPEELRDFLIHKAGIGLSEGRFFGHEGGGFMRINIATPRSNVMRALAQMEGAVRAL